ncbi:predicted protein [Sclerotinia sclerotiorum 1980 UF-70]|uniref:Uncharacterized protein n=1 Tax=Sclerotinia sclerotiorum (strain ATCC 18683 / 1980 / Ss-1) TaxID=665079 RepID=A7EEY3_SCLS1|nr:predicted protein [Sclerotinia sclerotiorum 1980 UF-70]EDO01399.1 predicted protein [Sclerotinia sclerotiorum 1980 UF-70]
MFWKHITFSRGSIYAECMNSTHKYEGEITELETSMLTRPRKRSNTVDKAPQRKVIKLEDAQKSNIATRQVPLIL